MTEPNAMVLTNVSEVVGALMNLAHAARQLEMAVDNLGSMPEVISAQGFGETIGNLHRFLGGADERSVNYAIALRETLRMYRERCAKGDA